MPTPNTPPRNLARDTPRNPPRPNAVALAYRTGEAAPRVVAKGQGLIAQEIVARAREAGVYVHESADLVALLMQVDLDNHIPPQLYIAVAELLAWLYQIEQGGNSTSTHTVLPEFAGDIVKTIR